MNINDFNFITGALKQRSGLLLSKDKAYLLESRLNPVARKWQFEGFEELVAAVRLSQDEAVLDDIVEAMATTDSSFFGDQTPFEQLRIAVLPYLLESRAETRALRIWVAGCGDGQEAVSLAIILKENEDGLRDWRVEIIATDISKAALKRAKTGTYTQLEVQCGLPVRCLLQHFKQAGDRWQLAHDIRELITYRYFNLLNNPIELGRLDIVFCRNVLAHHDLSTKAKILSNIGDVIAEDGVLYLGAKETTVGICERFRPVAGQRQVYTVNPSGGGEERMAS